MLTRYRWQNPRYFELTRAVRRVWLSTRHGMPSGLVDKRFTLVNIEFAEPEASIFFAQLTVLRPGSQKLLRILYPYFFHHFGHKKASKEPLLRSVAKVGFDLLVTMEVGHSA